MIWLSKTRITNFVTQDLAFYQQRLFYLRYEDLPVPFTGDLVPRKPGRLPLMNDVIIHCSDREQQMAGGCYLAIQAFCSWLQWPTLKATICGLRHPPTHTRMHAHTHPHTYAHTHPPTHAHTHTHTLTHLLNPPIHPSTLFFGTISYQYMYDEWHTLFIPSWTCIASQQSSQGGHGHTSLCGKDA